MERCQPYMTLGLHRGASFRGDGGGHEHRTRQDLIYQRHMPLSHKNKVDAKVSEKSKGSNKTKRGGSTGG